MAPPIRRRPSKITLSSVLFVPVKVLRASDGDQAVAVGEHGEDANLVVVFELSTYATSRYDSELMGKKSHQKNINVLVIVHRKIR